MKLIAVMSSDKQMNRALWILVGEESSNFTPRMLRRCDIANRN